MVSQAKKQSSGPWSYEREDGGYEYEFIIRDSDETQIARVINPYEYAFAGEKVCEEHDPIVESNARIMSSAPELLKGLKDIAYTAAQDGNKYIEQKANALIAKAEGISQ